jgi:hypothetical protein
MPKNYRIQPYRPAGLVVLPEVAVARGAAKLTGDDLVEWVIAARREGRHPIGLPGSYTTAVHNWLVRNLDRVEELVDIDAPSQCTISPLDGL